MTTAERIQPGIYPYEHRCYCGAAWVVTEENREEHERMIHKHRAEHKMREKGK